MQKKLFLKGEGDKWYLRNKKILKKRTFENDILCAHIDKILKLKSKKKSKTNLNSPFAVLEKLL